MKQITISHGGTMRFWGIWFGKPMDNYHTVISAALDEKPNILTINFDGGEKCIVYEPDGIVSSENTFYIENATRVIWTHYYYGRPPTPENLLTSEYVKVNEKTVILKRSGCLNPGTWQSDPTGFYAVEIC